MGVELTDIYYILPAKIVPPGMFEILTTEGIVFYF